MTIKQSACLSVCPERLQKTIKQSACPERLDTIFFRVHSQSHSLVECLGFTVISVCSRSFNLMSVFSIFLLINSICLSVCLSLCLL